MRIDRSLAVLYGSTRRPLTSAAQLNNMAVVVIGLWHYGILDFHRIADLLRLYPDVAEGEDLKEPAEARRLVEVMLVLLDTKNALVRQWVDEGLTAGVYGTLGAGQWISCPLCHARISAVPCPRCGMWAKPEKKYNHLEPPASPCAPTRAYPGSPEKIRVLQERLANGQELFHPADPVVQDSFRSHNSTNHVAET